MYQAEQMNIKIDEDDAVEILKKLLDKHDASVGVTWDTINYWLDDYPSYTD